MKWRRFIPHIFLFVAGLGYALWSFCPASLPHAGRKSVARSHALPHAQLLRVGDALVLPVPRRPLILMVGLILLAISRVWFEARHRSLSPLGELPQWLLDPRGKGSVIVKS